MTRAIEQAKHAADCDEIPVGAVLVDQNNQLVAEGYNQPIDRNDPTAHAEIVVIRKAAQKLDNYRLPDTTLYVTLEPCTMCVGAIVQARIKRVVFGALEPKAGSIESARRLFDSGFYNHVPSISGGVLESECSKLLSSFFEQKRSLKKSR